MAAMRGSRVPLGSAAWIADERSSALNVAQSEREEFSFSVRNDFDWLNEHMAEIFNENEINVAEIFKTPGKLRGKTPRTARKVKNDESRMPLSDVFASESKGAPSPFSQQLNRLQSSKQQLQAASSQSPHTSRPHSPLKPQPLSQAQPHHHAAPPADSGYYGSQDIMDIDQPVQASQATQLTSPLRCADERDASPLASPTVTKTMQSPTRTFQTAKEEQTTRIIHESTQKPASPVAQPHEVRSPVQSAPSYPELPATSHFASYSSPKKLSPAKPSPTKQHDAWVSEDASEQPGEANDEVASASDGSSPIRPVVRKSSLNFASLPAREPLATKKSMGARLSRASHDNRASHYGRHTNGKSLGNVAAHLDSDDDDLNEDLGADGVTNTTQNLSKTEVVAEDHNKAYTQRLQDQISLLGKSQPNASRPSKSIPSSAAAQQLSQAANAQSSHDNKNASPERSPNHKVTAPPTPGAFPEDDEDDWNEPPAVPEKDACVSSPRPVLPKSYSTDVMEGIHASDTVGGAEFALPKQLQTEKQPASEFGAGVPERTTSAFGHGKSASVPSIPMSDGKLEKPQKAISVSNPAMAALPEDERPETPKSPSRVPRDSPLKHVKNKLSSIIKSSRGLLASSAAISAEGKSSILSPSTTRLGFHASPSTNTLALASTASVDTYSDMSQKIGGDAQTVLSVASPTRPVAKRTRSSIEREKEEKRKEKEAQKEARLMAEQDDKLAKAREKEREKARVFSKEQEKTAALEKRAISHKEQEKPTHPLTTPAAKESRPTRTSPRKAKAPTHSSSAAKADDDADVQMAEAAAPLPSSATRSAGPSQTARSKEIRRPIKPSKEAPQTARQAPTVIRVNTGSQHSQYHPSNNALSSNLRETLGPSQPQHQLKSKTSQGSLQNKPSLQSLKSSASSSGRPKALELAARRKEQEEREAQRKRDAKLEIERKRAAIQEEERKQEQQRRQEVERQKEKEREQAEAKKNAQRQAAIEKAKQTRAPPPAARTQPNGPPSYATGLDKVPGSEQRVDGPARPPSRLTSATQRSQEDAGRPVNAVLSHNAKTAPKRPMQQEDAAARNPQARNGPSYQAKDAKRRRTSDDFFDELDMESQPSNIKGPPVRPSGGVKKDGPTKSMFSGGYTAAPPPSASRDLFKATVTAQHNSAVKQPMDMSHFSKGAIPFAPNPNPAGSTHKTPVRPPVVVSGKSTAKSAKRSSPRFQNGESIELPEIETDDEDEDDDDGHVVTAAWADSPDLRRALARQEVMDPNQIFGPPAPLIMEEVFSKSKDKWHKFRARTSSANWSGSDRLTEEDIRKDLVAREKLRREGAWSYEMSKDLL